MILLPTLIFGNILSGQVNSSLGQINKVKGAYKQQGFSILQNGYGTIDVFGPTVTATGALPADWFDLSWKYRVKVWVNETNGIYRPAQLVTISLEFQENQAKNGTIIVVDNSSAQPRIIPCQVWGATYYESTDYYQSAYISWITQLSTNEHKLFYVYWSDEDTGYSYTFPNDKNRFLVYNDLPDGSYHIGNKYFETNFYINGGIDIAVEGTTLADNGFFYQPYTTQPSNATYIWLDSYTMGNYTGYSGRRDHLKILAWDDSTRVKIYGYNSTIGAWELVMDTIIDANTLLRYPPSGESYYNLTRVESNKPVSIFVTDLGSTQANNYGVDHDSDDAFYSYFGTRAVLWVPRDLFVCSYFNNTHVKITDLSEGDDSFDLDLNATDVWFHGMGDTRTYTGSSGYYYYDRYESEGPSFFENDIVRVEADKPITIIGGLISDNVFGIVKGFAYKRYVFPFFSRFSVVPLYNDTNANITMRFYNATSESFEDYKTYSLTLNSNNSYVFSDDPPSIRLVVAVDLYKNVSSNPVDFNITIMAMNETAYAYSQRPYWYKVKTYLGTLTPTATPNRYHYDDPTSGNWNETVITLESGKYYWIVLGWNTSDDLDLYTYWYGKSPLMDGTGDDYEIAYRGRTSLGSSPDYGNFANTYEAYWYMNMPIKMGGTRPYSVELKHEEWGVAIVETDKPVLVYTGYHYYRYEGTHRSSSYGGSYQYIGKIFDFVFPSQNRYIKIGATEPDTHVQVWINGSVADWRARNVASDVQVVSPNTIILNKTTSWVDIPLPRNTRVHIESDKPVTLKVLYGWSGNWRWDYYSGQYSYPEPSHYNPVYYSSSAGVYYSHARFGYEELALHILDPSMPIITIEKEVEGPLFTKLKVSWGILNNHIVEDHYTILANSSAVILERNINLPEYLSYDGFLTMLGFEFTDFWNKKSAIQQIALYPYTALYRNISLVDQQIETLTTDFIFGTYEANTEYSIGFAPIMLSSAGLAQFLRNDAITGYIYDLELSRIYHSIHLQFSGGTANKITAKYAVTIGSFGNTIISETKTNLLANKYPITVSVGMLESTAIDVTVRVKDLDNEPISSVIVNLCSSSMNVNRTLTTDSTGIVTFSDVPASTDYEISLYWTNDSTMFQQFPYAEKKDTSQDITGDRIYDYTIAVKDFYLNVKDGRNDQFSDEYYTTIIGTYVWGATQEKEIVVNATNVLVRDHYVKFDNMPVGRSTTEGNYMKYNITVKYDSQYDISVENETTFVWEKTNTTNTIDIKLAVANLYVRVLDLKNTTLPAADVFLYYSGETKYTTHTNGSGIAEVPYLPFETYELNAEYYATRASSNTTLIFNNTVYIINITLPIKFGEKPGEISLDRSLYEGYWGQTISVYAQFIDTGTEQPVEANLTLWVINPITGEILISGVMVNVTETLYSYTILLSGQLKAGQSYTIQVSGYSSDYIKPQPANATLTISPIGMVITQPTSLEGYWDRSVTIWINVTHTEDFYYTPVSGLTITATIMKNGYTYRTLEIPEYSGAEGYYRYELHLTGNLSVGLYTIYLDIRKLGYANTTIQIPLSILTVPTTIISSTTTIEVAYYKNIEVDLWYNRTDTLYEGIAGAQATFELYNGTGYLVLFGSATDLGYGKYRVSFNSSQVTLGTYLLKIKLSKENYQAKELSISVTINPIQTYIITTPESASITWGDNFTYTITIIDLENNIGLEHVDINMTVRLGTNETAPGTAITLEELGNGEYAIYVKSGELSIGNYTINLEFSKEFYTLESRELYLTINPVNVEVNIDTRTTIEKNPITSSAVSTVTITLREYDTKAPLTDSSVTVEVWLGNTLKYQVQATESTSDPGTYIAKIDWTNLEPGAYRIIVKVNKITRNGYETTSTVAINVVSSTEVGVNVDFFGGSTVIGGKKLPNLLIYPPLVASIFIVGFVVYKYYSWYKLPIEVREIIKVIKQLEKGILEYEVLSRDEAFKEIIKESLEL